MTTITTAGFQPACSSRAAMIVDSATTAPTERSMPPVMITKLIPIARTIR